MGKHRFSPLNQILKVDLDLGESETTVLDGLKEKGYQVNIWLSIMYEVEDCILKPLN